MERKGNNMAHKTIAKKKKRKALRAKAKAKVLGKMSNKVRTF